MSYIAQLYSDNPIAFISAIATALATVVAWLVYLRNRSKEIGASEGGSPTVKTGNVSGNVIVQTGSGTIGDVSSVNYAIEDSRAEWRVYEVAFLWHDREPPGVAGHFEAMTRDIEETKALLHNAIQDGRLPMIREERSSTGFTRWVSRDDLVAFAESLGEKPKFLFHDER